MKKQIKSNWQTKLFASIAIMTIFSVNTLTFAQSTTHDNHAVQNLWLNNSFASNSNFLFGQPKPDFSAMEQWYEIVKYEYGDVASGENKLFIILKAKVEKRPTLFAMQFRDKDGLLVKPWDSRYGNGFGPSKLTPVGEPEKIQVYTPGESDMERVVSATVVRIKE